MTTRTYSILNLNLENLNAQCLIVMSCNLGTFSLVLIVQTKTIVFTVLETYPSENNSNNKTVENNTTEDKHQTRQEAPTTNNAISADSHDPRALQSKRMGLFFGGSLCNIKRLSFCCQWRVFSILRNIYTYRPSATYILLPNRLFGSGLAIILFLGV